MMTPTDLIVILKTASAEELAEIRRLLGGLVVYAVPQSYPVYTPSPAPTPVQPYEPWNPYSPYRVTCISGPGRDQTF